jgi:hypothetical protein
VTHIDLGLSRPPLSLNDRMHWRVKAQHVAQLRLLAAHLARNVTPVERAVVTLHYRPRDRRARDAANLHATLKPLTDGLVDAGVLTRGDSSEYVEERCRIHPPEPGMPGALWLTIEEVA